MILNVFCAYALHFLFCMKEYTYIFDRPLVAIQALDLLWLREEGEGELECIYRYLMDKCLRGQTGRDRAGEVATQDGVETWVHVPIVFFFLGCLRMHLCLVETNAVPTPTVLVLVVPYITLMDR